MAQRGRFDVDALGSQIEATVRTVARPIVVAIDGRSGVGKSTLARELAVRVGGAVIEGDDFFAGGVAVRDDSPLQRVAACIDWRRQRDVLEAIRRGARVSWHAFDWEAFDGRLADEATVCAPARVVVLEGVYSARPELADLIDLRWLLRVPDEVRIRQLREREGEIGAWERQWHDAEDVYFAQVMPPHTFDRILEPIEIASR